MLKLMRHHAKYFYILFFIVILSFIFWGVGTVDQQSQQAVVAEIGPYKVGYDEYAQVYDRYFRFYRDVYKEKFDEKMQETLKDTVVDTIIDNKVLLIAAQELGMTVSDAELREAIVNEPSFQTNGVFDNTIYQNSLRLNRITPEAYEAQRRQDLMVQKMQSMLSLGVPAAATAEDRDKMIMSFVEGYKKKLKITINKQLIS